MRQKIDWGKLSGILIMLAISLGFWWAVAVMASNFMDEFNERDFNPRQVCESLRKNGWDVSQHDCVQAFMDVQEK